MTVALYLAGDSVPLLVARGILPPGYVTAIPSGRFDRNAGGIRLLIDSDTSRQAPMTLLKSLPNDTSKGWFRGVNLMGNGGKLCVHPPERDSACLPYRYTTQSYEDYGGSSSGPIEWDWKGRTEMEPVGIARDTLRTLVTLDSANGPAPVTLLLSTPLRQPVPSGKGMLRILNAAPGSGQIHVAVMVDDFFQLRVDTLGYQSITDYQPVPIARTTLELHGLNSSYYLGCPVSRDEYQTLIIIGSGDTLSATMLYDSELGAQILYDMRPASSVDENQARGIARMTITPNPAVESATITSPASGPEWGSLALYDARGNRIFEQNQAFSSDGTITLSTAS
jgi:hypothetical protein